MLPGGSSLYWVYFFTGTTLSYTWRIRIRSAAAWSSCEPRLAITWPFILVDALHEFRQPGEGHMRRFQQALEIVRPVFLQKFFFKPHRSRRKIE